MMLLLTEASDLHRIVLLSLNLSYKVDAVVFG